MLGLKRAKPVTKEVLQISDVKSYERILLHVPSIVCEGCEKTIRTLLSSYLFHDNQDSLIIDIQTKVVSVVVAKGTRANVLIDALDESGYNDPKITILSNQFPVDAARSRVDSSHNVVEQVLQTRIEPITYCFKVTTARTDQCLDAITNRFHQMSMKSSYDTASKTIAVTSQTEMPLENIVGVITATGHQVELAEPKDATTKNEKELGKRNRPGNK